MGIRRFETSGPVSRVLSSGIPNGRSFIWDAGYPTPLAAYPSVIARRAISPLLFGLAPNGVYRAAPVTESRGGLLPHRFTLARCAKYRARWRSILCGTFHRVAPPGCYPAFCPVELGLSSSQKGRDHPARLKNESTNQRNGVKLAVFQASSSTAEFVKTLGGWVGFVYSSIRAFLSALFPLCPD